MVDFGKTSGLFGIFRQLIVAAELRQPDKLLGRDAMSRMYLEFEAISSTYCSAILFDK